MRRTEEAVEKEESIGLEEVGYDFTAKSQHRAVMSVIASQRKRLNWTSEMRRTIARLVANTYKCELHGGEQKRR